MNEARAHGSRINTKRQQAHHEMYQLLRGRYLAGQEYCNGFSLSSEREYAKPRGGRTSITNELNYNSIIAQRFGVVPWRATLGCGS
jgi:hypothetical protein